MHVGGDRCHTVTAMDHSWHWEDRLVLQDQAVVGSSIGVTCQPPVVYTITFTVVFS